MAAAVRDRRADTRPPPSAARLGQPVALLSSALSWDPDKRPATARDLARELGRFLDDEPPRSTPELPTGPVLVFCVLLAVVLFVVTYLGLSR